MLSDEIAIFLEIVISIIMFITACYVIIPLVIVIIGVVLLLKGSKEEHKNENIDNKNKKLNTKQIVGLVLIVLGINAFLAGLITIIKIYLIN